MSHSYRSSRTPRAWERVLVDVTSQTMIMVISNDGNKGTLPLQIVISALVSMDLSTYIRAAKADLEPCSDS